MSFNSGGSTCGPGQVAVCCKGVPSGGSGDLLLKDFGPTLKSVHCGVGMFLTDSGTPLTGRPSIFISVSHSQATLASRFLERRENTLANQIHIRERNSHHLHNRRRGRHTQKKIQGIPNTLHLRLGTNGLENFAAHLKTRQTIHTDSFLLNSTLSLSPCTSLLPLLLSSSFSCLFIFSLSSSLRSTEKVILMNGLVFLEQVSVFSGKSYSVFQHTLFGDVPQHFLRNETSYLKLFPKPSAPSAQTFAPDRAHVV